MYIQWNASNLDKESGPFSRCHISDSGRFLERCPQFSDVIIGPRIVSC